MLKPTFCKKYIFPSLKPDVAYIIAIIDFFQLYDLRKNLETKFKLIKAKKTDKEKIISNSLRRTCSSNLAKRSFNSLSGGEKQKVQLSRCLAQNAKVLLLDEPTASLDAENKEMVIKILLSLTISEIQTIIVVTHDKELAKMPGWDKLYLEQNSVKDVQVEIDD